MYVFCALAHKDQDSLDPLDAGQWEFYVLSTAVLNSEVEGQERLSLSRLLELGPEKVAFGGISAAIARQARP